MKTLTYGHLVEIELYRELLEKSGIECYIENEFEQASHAGFGSGLPGNADLMVDDDDFKRAESILNNYKNSNSVE